MKVAALIYLSIGVLLIIIGPLVRKIDQQVREARPAWKRVLLEIILRILCIVFYPIILVVMAIEFHRSKSFNKNMEARERDPFLYFSDVPGAGIIKCKVCNFSEEIVGFLHGHESDPWSQTGFQCQTCGKFHAIDENSQDSICKCGGKLDRDEPLFCPKCKTKDVSYRLKYMT